MAWQITLADLRRMADESREEIWADAKRLGVEPKIYLHWSAGSYTTVFEDYHVNIKGDGTMWATGSLSDPKSHTYRRNTGSVGLSLCACAYGNTNNLGQYAPTAKQIEVMAQAIVAVADGLWLTIDKTHVMTHGEAGDNEDGYWAHDPYGPKNGCERWDLEFLGTNESPKYNPWATDGTRGGDVLRGKANWYRKQNGG